MVDLFNWLGDGTKTFVGVSYYFSNGHKKERVCARFAQYLYSVRRESFCSREFTLLDLMFLFKLNR